jgi:hypothetical protein
MRVRVRVRDAAVVVDVGPGHQRLKWLAMVALQRYQSSAVPILGGVSTSHALVAVGLMDGEGNELPPNKSIRVALSDGQEVFVLLQDEQEEESAVHVAKGSSRWLTMQGAAPAKCLISGPGITYALAGQAAGFSLQARDAYGNLTSNGGEKFEVHVSPPDSLTAKQLAEYEADAPPQITDLGDGSYLVSHLMSRKGRYDVNVELDGEPIAGSPFATVAVKPFVSPIMKWLTPRITGVRSAALAPARRLHRPPWRASAIVWPTGHASPSLTLPAPAPRVSRRRSSRSPTRRCARTASLSSSSEGRPIRRRASSRTRTRSRGCTSSG